MIHQWFRDTVRTQRNARAAEARKALYDNDDPMAAIEGLQVIFNAVIPVIAEGVFTDEQAAEAETNLQTLKNYIDGVIILVQER